MAKIYIMTLDFTVWSMQLENSKAVEFSTSPTMSTKISIKTVVKLNLFNYKIYFRNNSGQKLYIFKVKVSTKLGQMLLISFSLHLNSIKKRYQTR